MSATIINGIKAIIIPNNTNITKNVPPKNREAVELPNHHNGSFIESESKLSGLLAAPLPAPLYMVMLLVSTDEVSEKASIPSSLLLEAGLFLDAELCGAADVDTAVSVRGVWR